MEEDRATYGQHSHGLTCVRYYTGIHDLARRPAEHASMARRLKAYEADRVNTIQLPVRYDFAGRARENR